MLSHMRLSFSVSIIGFAGDIQELQESSRHKEGVDVDRFLTNSDPGLSVVQRQKILEEEDEAYIRLVDYH